MKSNRLTVQLVAAVLLVALSFGHTIVSAAPPAKEDSLLGITQNWDKVLPAAQRFTVLAGFNNEAVRDNQTGLVWEKSPATTTVVQNVATGTCINKTVGLQKGWRLPSIPELASLIDPSNSNPTLPTGHPFLNVQPSLYWSASTFAEDQTAAWHVGFDNGEVQTGPKAQTWRAWCVRGPMNADKY
jgi:hypothetical protein